MVIPDPVNRCIAALESQGYAAYLVGGCVRDPLLGIEPQDYDLCTSALPEQTEAVFADHRLILTGKKHGTVAVVTDYGVVEITTFRTEGDYADSRHPGWVAFVPEIEKDLARRDFTVNAMAYSPSRGFADPFGGREDLNKKILRAVGDPAERFTEDPLRILRGARFSVKYRLTPERATEEAMLRLAPLMDKLARERVFSELCKLLPLAETEDLLRFGPVLAAVVPELEPTLGFDQHSPHHAYDVFTHIAHVTAAVPASLPLRWAALLHDVGKPKVFTQDATGRGHFYGHARESARMADEILRRLKAPTLLRQQVTALVENHMLPLEPDKKLLRRRISRFGLQNLRDLLALQEADMGGKGTGETGEMDRFDQIRSLIGQIEAEDACLGLKDLAVNGSDLMNLGFSGPRIGECLNYLLDLVLEEQVENTHDALLDQAVHYSQER